jgi:hypothetical protein
MPNGNALGVCYRTNKTWHNAKGCFFTVQVNGAMAIAPYGV